MTTLTERLNELSAAVVEGDAHRCRRQTTNHQRLCPHDAAAIQRL
jgi:hypothetical protein